MRTDDFLADYERVLHDAALRRLQGTAPARSRSRVVHVVAFAAAAMLTAVVVALLVRGDGSSTPPADERPVPTATATVEVGPPPYSVLDGEPLAEERYRELAEDPVLRGKGIRWDRLYPAVSGHDVTVYATRTDAGEVCAIASSARYGTTFGCGDPTGHTRAITLRFGVDRERSLVAGLVPDGARRVELWTGSSAVAVAVERNAFVALINHEEASVRWRDGAGSHQEQLSPSPRGPSAPDPYSGRRETQSLSATAPDPAGGEAAGMLTYRSRGGQVCMISGFVRGGKLGRYGPNGAFSLIDPADGPGSCGDLAENLRDFGGVALATSGVLRGGTAGKQTLVYGLVASRTSTVTVTWRDGTRDEAVVSATDAPEELDGAEGAYVLLSRPGKGSGVARVRITAADGTVLHTFAF